MSRGLKGADSLERVKRVEFSVFYGREYGYLCTPREGKDSLNAHLTNRHDCSMRVGHWLTRNDSGIDYKEVVGIEDLAVHVHDALRGIQSNSV